MKALLALSVTMTVASAVLFWLDLVGYFNPIRTPIATLSSAEGTVLTLESHGFSWDRANSGGKLALLDAVSTGENSEARILFDAGAELNLGPGSMVVLTGVEKEFELKLIAGVAKLRIAKSAPPIFKTRSITKAASIRVETVEDHEIEKIALKTAAVPSPSPRKIAPVIPEATIKNPSIALQSQAEIRHVASAPATPVLVEPQDGFQLDPTLRLRLKPAFIWQEGVGSSEKATTFEITYAPVDSAAQPRLVRSQRPELAIPELEAGKYHWWVRALSKDGLRSPASSHRSFEMAKAVLLEKPPEAPAPAPMKKLAPPRAPAQARQRPKTTGDTKVKLFPVSVE